MHNHTLSFRHQLTYRDEVITTNSIVLIISFNCMHWQKLRILIVLFYHVSLFFYFTLGKIDFGTNIGYLWSRQWLSS